MTTALEQISISSSTPGAFEITDDRCAGEVVKYRRECVFYVDFKPTHSGPFEGTINVPVLNPELDDLSATLSGTGGASCP